MLKNFKCVNGIAFETSETLQKFGDQEFRASGDGTVPYCSLRLIDLFSLFN